MAYHGYMSIKGSLQGLISAGCSTQDSIGNKCQVGHRDEIMVLAFDHGLTNADNTQRALHRPVYLTKFVDKATPLLAQALDSGERVECDIQFFRTSAAGLLEKYYSVRLGGAVIVQQNVAMPHAVLLNEQEPQEYLALRYRDISWVHHVAGTTGYATWGEE